MKKWIALLLCLVQLAMIFSGCGGETPADTTQAEAQTEAPAPVEEPTTEPTIDPEELFLSSLDPDIRRAYEAELVTRDQLEDLERTVTVGEAAAILQKAQVNRTGTESRALADLQTHETFAQRNADRGWLMGIPALVDLETAYPDRYTDYEQWTQEVLKIQYASLELHFAFANRLGMSVYLIGDKTLCDKKSAWDMTFNPDGEEFLLSAWDVIITNDSDYADFGKAADGLYVIDSQMLSYGLVLHDGTTGKKFMEMDAGQFNPFRELTFGELLESALRLYNAPNPVEKPEFVAAEEVGKYNTDIITKDLLSKQTTLPQASNAKLPQWHGVLVEDLQTMGRDTVHQDAEIYEYEIQAIKDAGFNFIGLNVDFSSLQDHSLFDPARVAFKGLVDSADKGKLSVQRLEQLDQVIAWCVERDIHVNLRAVSLPNMLANSSMAYELDFNNGKYAQPMANIWQALARRYADIPNEYLSFTPFSGDYSYTLQLIQPSIAAIQAESPDRCIIAEVDSYKIKAEEYAGLGVALSSRIWDDEKYAPIFTHSNCVKWNGPSASWDSKCLETMANFTWPFENSIDALSLMSIRKWGKIPSVMDTIQVAKDNGVGFMLGDFGVRLWDFGNMESLSFPRIHYPTDSYTAMIQDFVSTIESMGYGWCFASWYGPYGVSFGMPVYEDIAYTQLADYPYYLDQSLLTLFRELNGLDTASQTAPATASAGTDAQAVSASLENPYYEAAAKAGISTDNVSTDPINGREMAKLLDQFVAYAAPHQLETWKNQYFTFRGSLKPLSRMDAMAAIYLAVETAQNTQYLKTSEYVYEVAKTVKMDWNAEYLDWMLFGGFDNLPKFQQSIYGNITLDAAAHYYNLGRQNTFTGDCLYDLDPATNTMRYEDEASWADVIQALGRILIPADYFAQAAAEDTPLVDVLTPEQAEAMVTALNVAQDQFGYYLAAAQAGIPMDNVGVENITGTQMAALLDQFVYYAAPDKLSTWRSKYPAFRGSQEPLTRMEVLVALFLAAQITEDPAYTETYADPFVMVDQVKHNWDGEYMNWRLFESTENLPTYSVDIFKDASVDAAVHYYNLGRTNLLTGESLLTLDKATNTMRYEDKATFQDALLALGRLLYDDNAALLNGLYQDSTWLFEGEDDAEIAKLRTQADARRDAIVNSKTTIVKSDTFIPGETYTGKAYYVSPKGNDKNDGLTPETAWQTTNRVTDTFVKKQLKKGDAVFFERGYTYRVDPYYSLAVSPGVTYSAYGEGPKPILTLAEGNKADPSFWKLHYNKDGMKIWKYHQNITDVGGIIFNDSSYAERVWEWPTNGKWQAINLVEQERYNGITEEDVPAAAPFLVEATGEYRTVEENMPENLTYICRVDISNATYPINFVENPKTGMPYTGELYLRCDEGNPGEVFDEIAIIGYSDVTKGCDFMIINATDISDFVLDNLCIKYHLDTAIHCTLKSKNVIVQNCEISWGGTRNHAVNTPDPTLGGYWIGDSIYNVANNAIIRNNYIYQASGIGFENGPMGYEKKMGVFTCTGNLIANTPLGIRANMDFIDAADVPFDKVIIQDNMILDTDDTVNFGSQQINVVIDVCAGPNFAKEILVADNVCIGSDGAMVRSGNPLITNEVYTNNTWVHDPKLPMAVISNRWSIYWISMEGAK